MLDVPVALVLAAILSGQAPAVAPVATPVDRAFVRLYNFDFAGAHAALDDSARSDPGNPLTFSVRAAAYLFTELDRLRILEFKFFMNDDTVIGARPLTPDPSLRTRLFNAIGEARRLAGARLATSPRDQNALFALCMSASVVTDYTGLVEGRHWRSVGLARETKKYADKLLAFDPPFYDAYYTCGTMEYVVGSLPFFVRWFVRYDRVEGNKRLGIEQLKLVAHHGRYYGPFARILLAVISIREGKAEEAEKLLVELSREFPENPLLKKEAARAGALARRRRKP
jgi:hypothetical protein